MKIASQKIRVLLNAATAASKIRKRLNAVTADPRISVDREGSGRISGVSVITTGPALGHGFQIDKTMVQQTADALSGQPGRWTHGHLCDDGLAKHLGTWENSRVETFTDEAGVEQSRALADFVFADSAHSIQPDGLSVSAPVYLMDRVEEDPSLLGVSIVADLAMEASLAEGEEEIRLARLEAPEDLKRGDFVADPAANRHGLSLFKGTPSELAEEATNLLGRITDKFGEDRVHEFLGKALGVDLVSKVSHSALKLENVRLKKVIEDRRVADEEGYISDLAARSAALQRPLKAAQLKDVRELFALGKGSLAKSMGEALIASSKALSEETFAVKTTAPLAHRDDSKKKAIAVEARGLRLQGWTIELNEDETEITKATPPNRQGK